MATVRQALDQEDQMPVTNLQGTITKVSERKSGEGKYGEWSLQFLTLEDGEDSISVMAKNRDEDFAHLKGQNVTISAVKSKQHGWVGAESFDNEYKGETERVVKLTGAGKIEKEDAPSEEAASPDKGSKENSVSDEFVAVAWKIAKSLGVDGDTFKDLAMERYQVSSSHELSIDQVKDLVEVAGKSSSRENFAESMRGEV